MCKKEFKARNKARKYCGSADEVGTCNYKKILERRKENYNSKQIKAP